MSNDTGSPEGTQNHEKGSSGESGRARSKRDFLEEISDLIISRASNAHSNLIAMLTGTLELFVRDRPYRVIFDFSAKPPQKLSAGSKECECSIELDERTLSRIHQGELNPQLAMVSDKMLIKGKAGLAVYFFNLLGN